MKYAINLIVLMTPVLVFAAGGEHGAGHGEIPKAVLFQAINVGILIVGLVYFTKDAIVDFFAGRKAEYLEAAQKSAAARAHAEKEFAEMNAKIADLESSSQDSLKKAQAHAEEIKKQILDEANSASKRIRDDAELTVKLEVQRAQKELRTQLLQDSVEAARVVLTKDLGSSDQQKLQKDFINHIGV